MSATAALLLPAIRWDANHGYGHERVAIDKALELGVGGFSLVGGEQERVRALTKELRQKSRVPLLIAAEEDEAADAELERLVDGRAPSPRDSLGREPWPVS